MPRGKVLRRKLRAGDVFTRQEWAGFQLFMNEDNDNDGTGGGAACVACHVADWIDPDDYGDLDVVVPDWSPGGWSRPCSPISPMTTWACPRAPTDSCGTMPVDEGLAENGKFKVMTLRNIQLTKPYAHNGFFKSLKDITHFYNTRDVGKWPPPEVNVGVNDAELGNLGLSTADEAALVAFMMTLTDK